ncbi:MAG: Maf family protein, partial [Dehalococcoidia bacterium]
MTRVVLASASPRRRELIAALGVAFAVQPADVSEATVERDPVRVAEGLALRKARAVAELLAGGSVVIGSDTVVAVDGRILGKPADAREARAMLAALRARDHEVVTGVAVIARDRAAADHSRTAVRMRAYADAEVDAYVATGSPFDKAGGYAIQDEAFHPVERCDGCECGVIGLPLWTLRRLLRVAAAVRADAPALARCARCP